jgi:adenylate cyclase
MRHLARGEGTLRELNDLRGPMASILDYFVQQKRELERYKDKYGDLSNSDNGVEELQSEEASDTIFTNDQSSEFEQD